VVQKCRNYPQVWYNFGAPVGNHAANISPGCQFSSWTRRAVWGQTEDTANSADVWLIGQVLHTLCETAESQNELIIISSRVDLSPVHTVAKKCDCRRKRRDNGEIRRLSHFTATVWTGF